MSAAPDVRSDLLRLIDDLPAADLAELARIAGRLRRRHDRQCRLEWVSEYTRRLPEAERPAAWTALLWLVGEKPVEPTAEELRALSQGDADAIPWSEAKARLGL